MQRQHPARFALISLLTLASFGVYAGQGEVGSPDPDRIRKQAAAWQATPEERKLDLIGWARDIRDALRLGKQHNRPIFLFTQDGRMETGRC
ncbi:MAG: hypothetical protein FJX77_03560 [Armatimonadetes bacterium]|nr:hypothetical protein [Armatimonadota bacterium]